MIALILLGTCFAILIVGVLTAIPVLLLRRVIEGGRVFQGEVDEHRAEFFEKVFGLSRNDLEFFHFDGKDFHLSNGRHHFSQCSRVRHMDSKTVEVLNPALPHRTSWRYSRIDGGADRRYSNNHEILHSVKHSLLIEGSSTHKLITYDLRDGTGHELEMLNKFLAFSNTFDMEAILLAYASSKRDLVRLEGKWSSAVKRKKELDGALKATRRLGALPGANNKLDKIHTERKRVASSVSELGKRVLAAQDDLSRGIRRVEKMNPGFIY